MDFFAHQDEARRRTSLLLAYLLVAVVLIVLAVYVAVWLLFVCGSLKVRGGAPPAFLQPGLFSGVAAGTLAVILGGTLYKVIELRGGGVTVAEMLGGTLVPRHTQDFHERQLLNVVEEMAIAAGTAVPPVYVLQDEDAINAFAAGYSPGDAVVGVTRGTLLRLSRDELQGVVAHEFSHILNGDMRLNLRLIGILHGILVIALIGYGIVRGVLRSGGRSGRRGKGGGGIVAGLLFGVALVIIGYIGVLFAKMIQSAVSRQREFLADASAVQFTRNPGGIAGALKKIGGLVSGSRLGEPKAREASHLFFGNAVGSSWFGWLATHPPLTERIRRIDPSFDGHLPPGAELPAAALALAPGVVGYEEARKQARAATGGPRRVALDPSALVAQVGAPTGEHLQFARDLRQQLPPPLAAAIEEAAGAQAVLCCLLLSPSATVRTTQLGALAGAVSPDTRSAVDALRPQVAALPAAYRLALLDLAIPTLKELPAAELRRFEDTIRTLAEADAEVDLFEYALQTVLSSRIRGWLEPAAAAQVTYSSLTPLRDDCRLLLSTLAHLGTGEPSAERAFGSAAAPLGTVGALGLVPQEQCTLAAVDQVLRRMAHLAYPIRGRVLKACSEVVLADRKVDVEEAELLRAIAAAFDCPMPPLLPDLAQAA